jgi:hypothetical protein
MTDRYFYPLIYSLMALIFLGDVVVLVLDVVRLTT